MPIYQQSSTNPIQGSANPLGYAPDTTVTLPSVPESDTTQAQTVKLTDYTKFKVLNEKANSSLTLRHIGNQLSDVTDVRFSTAPISNIYGGDSASIGSKVSSSTGHTATISIRQVARYDSEKVPGEGGLAPITASITLRIPDEDGISSSDIDTIVNNLLGCVVINNNGTNQNHLTNVLKGMLDPRN